MRRINLRTRLMVTYLLAMAASMGGCPLPTPENCPLLFPMVETQDQDGADQTGTDPNSPGDSQQDGADDVVRNDSNPQRDPNLVVLTGAAEEPVTEVIPAIPYQLRSEDFDTEHPVLNGALVSFNTLAMIFKLGTTTAEADAVLQDIQAEIVGGMPGKAGLAPGVLHVRIPSTSHAQMDATIEMLNANPIVQVAVQLVLPIQNEIPTDNNGKPADWTWEVSPFGDNAGLEYMRVPQMWNLNDALTKSGITTPTGVADWGFVSSHEDLNLDNLTPDEADDHGTKVAGVIGAKYKNGKGIDGVNPYAAISVYGGIGEYGLFALMLNRPGLRVINMSQGLPATLSTADNSVLQGYINGLGEIFAASFELATIDGLAPLLVVSAGNESAMFQDDNGNFILQDARWASHYANAALVQGIEDIIVVEAFEYGPGQPTYPVRAPFSNIGGHVSAPGSPVMSTTLNNDYDYAFGTSFAAPHVAGLASYMLALEPGLTNAQVKQLILDNRVSVLGAVGGMDAFATVMDIDRITNTERVLRKLLDIDDGTPDGNQRVKWGTSTDYIDEDADTDGGTGDGKIDMSDFRRWRDWLIYIEQVSGLSLDGSPTHPKKDINGNQTVDSPADENIYPRGDFNGSGSMRRDALDALEVPGAAKRLSTAAQLTDLDMLKLLFNDPHYQASDLDNLLESGDIDVWPKNCLDSEDVSELISTVLDASGNVLDTHTHTTSDPRRIYTLKPDNYVVRIQAVDLIGQILFTNEYSVAVLPGSDDYINPNDCQKKEVIVRMDDSQTQVIVWAYKPREGITDYVLDEKKSDYDVIPRGQTTYVGQASESLERQGTTLIDASVEGEATQGSQIEFDTAGVPMGGYGVLTTFGHAQAYRQRWWTAVTSTSLTYFTINVPEGQVYRFRSEVTVAGPRNDASFQFYGSPRGSDDIRVEHRNSDLDTPYSQILTYGTYTVIFKNETKIAAIHGGRTNVSAELTMEYSFTLEPVATNPGNS